MSDTRNTAIAAARALFLKRGIEATRIEDVRDSCGVSTGSLYHHFGSKHGLLEAVIIDALADHKRHLIAAIEPAASAQLAVQAIIASTAIWITNNPDCARAIFRFRGALESAGSTALKAHNRSELLPLIKRAQVWVDKGELRSVPFALLMPLLLGPLHEYARSWLAGRTDQAPDQHIAVFVAAAWSALRP
jgi:AcrR family transcriptional regulator